MLSIVTAAERVRAKKAERGEINPVWLVSQLH